MNFLSFSLNVSELGWLTNLFYSFFYSKYIISATANGRATANNTTSIYAKDINFVSECQSKKFFQKPKFPIEFSAI